LKRANGSAIRFDMLMFRACGHGLANDDVAIVVIQDEDILIACGRGAEETTSLVSGDVARDFEILDGGAGCIQ